ncbi:MAG: hypothetical protein A2086_00950 [Spirochaetes bacterium GWD1_27_9]|nr:MAG: hypothetical protein A2Z98_03845 [Spirochaetes bacterium GWB1_27_13]OHD24213.1 MAG: hypothetical protein A2Y34_02530 [Spirochaetes bacterium GWC1_27_15]OHD33620.1 MAG: hypothetical protein A2086_00950 [Spirochaetes bacterium GWD1_27_9]
MKNIIKFFVRLFFKIIGEKNAKTLVVFIGKLLGADPSIIKASFNQDSKNLLITVYQKIGILNYGNEQVTGEYFVLENILKNIYNDEENIVFFDVGANNGNYSKLLRQFFKKPKIYAFEPFEKIYTSLVGNLSSLNINCINKALGATVSKINIYNDKNDEKSELVTIHKNSLDTLFQLKDIETQEVQMISIDSFCFENKINKIDFLKIDVEGSELEVLKGAKKLIEDNKIGIIQFEFNEFNIFAHVFLKDFYDILSQYNFYRIKNDGLIPILKYDSFNEIFKYQNILAINKNMSVKENILC